MGGKFLVSLYGILFLQVKDRTPAHEGLVSYFQGMWVRGLLYGVHLSHRMWGRPQSASASVSISVSWSSDYPERFRCDKQGNLYQYRMIRTPQTVLGAGLKAALLAVPGLDQ